MKHAYLGLLFVNLALSGAACSSDGDDDATNAGSAGTTGGSTGGGGTTGGSTATGGKGGAGSGGTDSGTGGSDAGKGGSGSGGDAGQAETGGTSGSGGTAMSEECTKYCTLFQEVCIDAGLQDIPDGQSCGDFCASFTADQYACRWVHTQLVVPENNPNHCQHAVGIGQCIDG